MLLSRLRAKKNVAETSPVKNTLNIHPSSKSKFFSYCGFLPFLNLSFQVDIHKEIYIQNIIFWIFSNLSRISVNHFIFIISFSPSPISTINKLTAQSWKPKPECQILYLTFKLLPDESVGFFKFDIDGCNCYFAFTNIHESLPHI